MKIAFLLYNAYGIGGTIRSTTNLSRALSARHDVEIVSVNRTADRPRLEYGRRVRLRSLIDWREGSPTFDGGHPSAAEPSEMYVDPPLVGSPIEPTRLTDERVAAYLRDTDADVVVATRPALNGYLARYGSGRQIRVGQEHLLLQMHRASLRRDQNAALAQLDGFVTVSERDAQDYRAALPDVSTRIVCIPNCSPAPGVQPSTGDSRTVVAAGRLIPVKRYERLVDAFAKVVAARPDWRLRLYGRGPRKTQLSDRVQELGLNNHVRLMGAVSPIEPEWAKGAIAAVASDFESFGMTILEAMHCGVPVVATDCPYGPGEIIRHGENGLLTPLDGGADALADALIRLIDDDEERRRLGEAAQRRVADYAPDVIAARYERLFEELAARRAGGRRSLATSIGGRLRRAGRTAAPLPRHGEGEGAFAGSDADPDGPAGSDGSATRPTAHCHVRPDGGIVVTVAGAASAADTADTAMDLLLRKRRDPGQRQVRLPMHSASSPGDGGDWTCTVERAGHVLAEGRWDCFVVPRGREIGDRRRLLAKSVQQAALLVLPPVTGPDGVSSWIPYPTSDGFLAVRTWLRAGYAEVEEVHTGTEAVSVTASLLGGVTPRGAVPHIAADARVTARSRQGTAFDLDVPVRPLGDGRFACDLPLAALLERCDEEQSLWDLTLSPAPDGDTVALGRITGDIVDRKRVDICPAVALGPADGAPGTGAVKVRPYFTADNGLAISARRVPSATGTVTSEYR